MKNATIISLMLFLALSCTNKNTKTYVEVAKSEDFKEVENTGDSVIELSSIINIEEWSHDNNGIVCRSYNSDKVLYHFDPTNFTTLDSAYEMGQGPDDLIVPRLMTSTDSKPILIDLATGKMIFTNEKTMDFANDKIIRKSLNSPIVIDFPIAGFNELHGDGRTFSIMNLTTGELIDSISFVPNQDKPNVDFKVSALPNRAVIASQFSDEVRILNFNDDYKVSNVTVLRGSGNNTNRPYYIDVVCTPNAFYLISLKEMEFTSSAIPEGAARIEVYDYNGAPLKLIYPEFIPRKILPDPDNKRILALSATDDDIHIITL